MQLMALAQPLTTVVQLLSILNNGPDWSYTGQAVRVGASGTVRDKQFHEVLIIAWVTVVFWINSRSNALRKGVK